MRKFTLPLFFGVLVAASPVMADTHTMGATVKHDAKVFGVAVKHTAVKIGHAAKQFGLQVAAATKQGVHEIRVNDAKTPEKSRPR